MCDVLREVYNEVINEKFDYDDFDQRIKLQKIVYMLENMGVHVGNYSFTWNKYGPYSIALDDDAYRCSKAGKEHVVNFTAEAESAFQQIKKFISRRSVYDEVHWLECISSLHFLKYVLGISEDAVIEELVYRKKYLNNMEENTVALHIANTLEIGT